MNLSWENFNRPLWSPFFVTYFLKKFYLSIINRNLKIHDVTDTVLHSLAGITIKNRFKYYSEEG